MLHALSRQGQEDLILPVWFIDTSSGGYDRHYLLRKINSTACDRAETDPLGITDRAEELSIPNR